MIIPVMSFLPGLKDDGLLYVRSLIVELKGDSVTLWDDIIRDRLMPLRFHYPKFFEGQVVLDGWET